MCYIGTWTLRESSCKALSVQYRPAGDSYEILHSLPLCGTSSDCCFAFARLSRLHPFGLNPLNLARAQCKNFPLLPEEGLL